MKRQTLHLATKLKAGKTYLHLTKSNTLQTMKFEAEEGAVGMVMGGSYFGPVDEEGCDIDLSHFDLSKIEPKKAPDKPGLWHCSNDTGGYPDFTRTICSKALRSPAAWIEAEWRYLGDYKPPAAPSTIPPKPENALQLMRLKQVICDGDGKVGDVRWCIKDAYRNFGVIGEDGARTTVHWLSSQCEPVEIPPTT